MIIMLRNIEREYCLFYTDPFLKENIFKKSLSNNEIEKYNELYTMISDFYKKVYNQVYRDNYYGGFMGYLDNYGYYEITDADRGDYNLSFLGEDVYNAALYIIDNIISLYGVRYEEDNQFKENYPNRFSDPNLEVFNNALYNSEYILSKWYKYFDGNIPSNIIKKYEEYMTNLWMSKELSIEWEYDANTQQFNYVKNKKMIK